MESILENLSAEIQRMAATADETVRRRTIDKLREMQYSLEPPEETMQRLIYTVCFQVSLVPRCLIAILAGKTCS